MELHSATTAQTPPAHAQRRMARMARLERLAALRLRTRQISLMAAGALLDGVSATIRRLPVQTRYAVSDQIIWTLGPLLRRAERVAEANFARVVGPAAHAVAARSLRNYGRMAMDFLASRTMNADELLALVETRGEDHFRAALAQGHGVIFALPHVGSWDVAAVFAQAYGCKLTIVTESDWATELVAGSRLAHGVTLAPRDQSLRPLFRALRRQECAVMLCDITPPGVQTAEVPFFGAPARFPLGPARLAAATGAPVLVIMSVRTADNRYIVEAQPALLPERPADRTPDHIARTHEADTAAIAMTAAIAAGFERIIRAYPDQWYPYHHVWTTPTPSAAPRDESNAEATRMAEALTDV
jgi:lauroyl/myristoyl acyltransferase